MQAHQQRPAASVRIGGKRCVEFGPCLLQPPGLWDITGEDVEHYLPARQVTANQCSCNRVLPCPGCQVHRQGKHTQHRHRLTIRPPQLASFKDPAYWQEGGSTCCSPKRMCAAGCQGSGGSLQEAAGGLFYCWQAEEGSTGPQIPLECQAALQWGMHQVLERFETCVVCHMRHELRNVMLRS